MNRQWIVLGFLFLMIGSSASGFWYGRLLTQDDVEFQERENEQGAALTSVMESEEPWESYNHWQCFFAEDLTYECADYDNGILVPSLRVDTGNEIFHFDVHVEDRRDCRSTLVRWRNLMSGGNEVCIFAAHMPDVDMDTEEGKPQSLWYMRLLKGANGYWSL